jgi:hypothetical protein
MPVLVFFGWMPFTTKVKRPFRTILASYKPAIHIHIHVDVLQRQQLF